MRKWTICCLLCLEEARKTLLVENKPTLVQSLFTFLRDKHLFSFINCLPFSSSMPDSRSERAPPPAWIQNGSCHHPLMESDAEYLINNEIDITEVFRASILFIISLLIILSNLCFIFSINVVTYKKVIPSTTRYLLTSFSCSQLVTGMLITMWGVYPTLTECWPYGELVCQLQAVLRGALRQQTAFSLVLIALERYAAQTDSEMSKTIFSKYMTVIYIMVTWLLSISIYSFIVFHPHGYYLSISSFSVCEPYYRSLRLLVITSCIFYFPTTMLLMYCYGTIYQSQKLKLRNRRALFSAIPVVIGSTIMNRSVKVCPKTESTATLVRCLSAISLTFIIVVTPWSILQVITSVTMEQVSWFTTEF